MEKRLRFSIWYFIAALLLVLLVHTYLVQEEVGQITYAQFKQLVEAGKVTDVVIGSDYVSGKLTTLALDNILTPEQIKLLQQSGGSTHYFRAVKVDDPKLIETLEAPNIAYSGRLSTTWLTN